MYDQWIESDSITDTDWNDWALSLVSAGSFTLLKDKIRVDTWKITFESDN